MAQALREQQLGFPVGADDRQTVATFLGRWLEDAVRPTVRASTYARYEGLVRVHLIPAIGRERLAKLSPQQVQAMMNAKLAAGLSPRTVGHLRAVLRRALNQAYRWGLVARNVATLVDAPRVAHHELTPLDPAQALAFLEAARGDRLEALYVLALTTGLRQGELLGLRWQDVDLEAVDPVTQERQPTLTVRQALQRVGGRPQFVEPKSSRARRSIALPGIVIPALREHRNRQRFEQRWAGTRWQDWGLVFASTIGTPLDGTNVTHRLQVILERAGLPRQRFHDLRHGAASLHVAAGTPMRQVQELLGHSDYRLTANLYAHVAPVVARDTAARMDAVLQHRAN
jgi:integrase